ncbi:hypothetical protein T09_11362 [Trichinella sp. T9]|nr:hypothetical protein T09_11362 [Trichinella sp. T9]
MVKPFEVCQPSRAAMSETQVHSLKIRINLCPFVCTPTSLDHFKKKNIVKRRLYIFKMVINHGSI